MWLGENHGSRACLCAISQVTLLGSLERTRPGARFTARVTLRAQAALIALGFVLSTLFGLIHEASTTHVRCAQHGELIDGDPSAANLASATGTARAANHRAQGRDATVRDLQAVAIHGHEHCALASAMRESRVAPRPPAIVPARVAEAGLAASAPRIASAQDRQLYRTAPKTSPPA